MAGNPFMDLISGAMNNVMGYLQAQPQQANAGGTNPFLNLLSVEGKQPTAEAQNPIMDFVQGVGRGASTLASDVIYGRQAREPVGTNQVPETVPASDESKALMKYLADNGYVNKVIPQKHPQAGVNAAASFDNNSKNIWIPPATTDQSPYLVHEMEHAINLSDKPSRMANIMKMTEELEDAEPLASHNLAEPAHWEKGLMDNPSAVKTSGRGAMKRYNEMAKEQLTGRAEALRGLASEMDNGQLSGYTPDQMIPGNYKERSWIEKLSGTHGTMAPQERDAYYATSVEPAVGDLKQRQKHPVENCRATV